MAVKLRLRRMGRKKRPVYAVVAADSRFPRDGRYIEDLGRYEPLSEPALVSLKDERILYWLEQGAQPSDTVRSILSKHGLMLASHMRRKGTAEEDIWAAVESHRVIREEKNKVGIKTTAKDRMAASLKEEEKVAVERAAEEAKKRAKHEAQMEELAKAEAEKARKKAAEAREKAAEEARTEQEAANVEQETADSASPAKAPAKEEAAAEKAPAKEEAAAEEAPAKEEAAAEEAPAKEEAAADKETDKADA